MDAVVDVSNVVLETERMRLRAWREEDLEDFYAYASVDGVGQLAGWKPHRSMEESRRILKMFIEGKKTFALELKETGQVIGSFALQSISADMGAPYTDYVGREIGYTLSKAYWGRSLMPECAMAVMEYYFTVEKYDYLMCSHAESNRQSQRVIEKCGFRLIKEMERTAADGNTHMSKYYAMTAAAFREAASQA